MFPLPSGSLAQASTVRPGSSQPPAVAGQPCLLVDQCPTVYQQQYLLWAHMQGPLRQLIAHSWGAVVDHNLIVHRIQLLCHAPQLGSLPSQRLQG